MSDMTAHLQAHSPIAATTRSITCVSCEHIRVHKPQHQPPWVSIHKKFVRVPPSLSSFADIFPKVKTSTIGLNLFMGIHLLPFRGEFVNLKTSWVYVPSAMITLMTSIEFSQSLFSTQFLQSSNMTSQISQPLIHLHDMLNGPSSLS